MRKSELIFNVIRLPVDFAMLLVAGLLTYLLRTQLFSIFRPVLFSLNLPLAEYIILVLISSLLFIGAYTISGLYSLRLRSSLVDEFFKVIIASSAGIMAVIIFIFLRQELFDSRFLVLGGWFLAIFFVFIGRVIIRYVQKRFIAKSRFGLINVVVIGNDKISSKIKNEIESDPSYGYRVVNNLDNIDMDWIRKKEFDEVILAQSNYASDSISGLIEFCSEHHISFKFIPDTYQILTSNFSIDIVGGLPLIEPKRTSLDGWGKVIKRFLDIVFSIFGLILISPLLFIIALMIKWETAGTVLVRLKRVSRNREFYLYKFRSMIKNAEALKKQLVSYNERVDGPLFKIKNDPRVTRVGRFIRKFRIDELPQLLNVAKGDISLVGPRPHQPDEISRYEKHHKKVLAIKAGMTGLAQASGSSDLPFEQEVSFDTFYIENWSLVLDFKIVLKTILKIFTDKSAV
jgi:exopolysaccharide biosynthesis polyprenyl glycosylphosphotransferase